LFTAVALAAAWAARPGVAAAGIVAVNSAKGSIVFDFTPPTDPPTPTSHTFDATIPGSDTVNFTEAFTGGNGSVSYNFPTTNAQTLSGSAETAINTNGEAPDATSSFDLRFTSDVPVHYRFTATVPFSPQSFRANLDGIVADAHFDSLGNGSGSIPFDEQTLTFGEFVREGTLPAGDHQFALLSTAFAGKTGGGDSAGNATVQISAVPLPPAAWSALSVMAGVAGWHVVRLRRPVAGRRE
jgi:hypothetical protein